MSPEISLVVGASTWANWTSYEVSADIETPADAWRVEAQNPTSAQLIALNVGQPVQILCGRVVVLRGYLERKDLRRSSSGTTVSLSGRDLAGPLVDCTPPTSWAWRNVSLTLLAQKALAELGVAATVAAHADAGRVLAWAKAEPGETYWQVIERYARKARLIPWMDASGVLHLDRPDYLSAPVAHLVAGGQDGNVVESGYSLDISGRCTDLTVLGQAKGDLMSAGAGKLKGSAADAELKALGLYRPAVLDDGDLRSSAEAKARAQWEVSNRQYRSDTLEYTVLGHGPTPTAVWVPDTQVTVLDALAGISGTRWISAVRLSRSDAGTRSTLTLRRPGLFLPVVA